MCFPQHSDENTCDKPQLFWITRENHEVHIHRGRSPQGTKSRGIVYTMNATKPDALGIWSNPNQHADVVVVKEDDNYQNLCNNKDAQSSLDLFAGPPRFGLWPFLRAFYLHEKAHMRKLPLAMETVLFIAKISCFLSVCASRICFQKNGNIFPWRSLVIKPMNWHLGGSPPREYARREEHIWSLFPHSRSHCSWSTCFLLTVVLPKCSQVSCLTCGQDDKDFDLSFVFSCKRVCALPPWLSPWKLFLLQELKSSTSKEFPFLSGEMDCRSRGGNRQGRHNIISPFFFFPQFVQHPWKHIGKREFIVGLEQQHNAILQESFWLCADLSSGSFVTTISLLSLSVPICLQRLQLRMCHV